MKAKYIPVTTEENIKTFYEWLGHKPNEWTELRAIEYNPNRKGEVTRDFVNNEEDFVKFCKRWNGERHVYAGLNPRKKRSGSNEDVARIIGIPFDIDPENKADSATDEEKQKARENADKFMKWLKDQGYLEPYFDDSGNGFHIIQKVDIPVTHFSWLENQLRNYFKEVQRATPYTKMDSIYDMARIVKVAGTVSLKGANTKERPHRTAKILSLGSLKTDTKLMRHIAEIKFQYDEEPDSSAPSIDQPEKWFLTDKRIRSLKPCQKHFLRKGGTLGKPDANRNEETGLRMNFVRCLNNNGFTEREILHIFRLFEDFNEEKSGMEIRRILAEKSSVEWGCKATLKNKGCLGRKCRHYLGNIEYAEVDPKEFVIFNKKGNVSGVRINAIVNRIQNIYMFLSTSAKSNIWVYNEATGVWDKHGEEVIKQTVKVWLGQYFRSFHAVEIVKQILFGNYQSDVFSDIQTKNRKYVVLENGVYNLETDKLENFNPYIYAINKLPVTYDPKATCPAIEKFLSEIAQPKDIIKLEELIGYCLYKSYKIARIIILEGKGANGKTTYLNLINAFLGHENVAHVTVQQILEGGFKTAEMYGKLANLCGDLPKKPLKDTATIKMLTGEDRSVVEQKYRDPFDYYNYAKQVYATNEVPKTWDDTLAFHRRFLIILFTNIFREGEKTTDINIIDKLTTPEELSGLFNKAIKRLKELLERGKFDNEPTVEEKRETYIKKSDPVQYFAEWFVEKDLGNWISKVELYNEYVNLCMKLGRTPTASNVFSREVRRFLPYIMEYKKKIDKKRVTGWKGIRVLTDKIANLDKTQKTLDQNHKKPVTPDAFQIHCFDCGVVLQPHEVYSYGGNRFCRECRLKIENQEEKKYCQFVDLENQICKHPDGGEIGVNADNICTLEASKDCFVLHPEEEEIPK